MNEQEKALKKMLEFCQWLIPNAKQLGLEQSKSIAMISQAQTPDDIVNGMNSLYQELGEEQFTALTQAFQQSKSQNIKMAKKGTKIDYLVDKLANGDLVEKPKRTRKGNDMHEYLKSNDVVYTRDIRNYGTPYADTTWTSTSGDLEEKLIRGADGQLVGITRWFPKVWRMSPEVAESFRRSVNAKFDEKSIPMNKKGAKIDNLVNKLQGGKTIPSQRKIDQRNIDLVERISETSNKPSRVSVERGGLGYITRATSDNDDYTLNTDGKDSMMWWNPYGREVILSNSGPNRSWVGYTQIMEDDGPVSVKLNSAMLNKVKQHMFKKLNVK